MCESRTHCNRRIELVTLTRFRFPFRCHPEHPQGPGGRQGTEITSVQPLGPKGTPTERSVVIWKRAAPIRLGVLTGSSLRAGSRAASRRTPSGNSHFAIGKSHVRPWGPFDSRRCRAARSGQAPRARKRKRARKGGNGGTHHPHTAVPARRRPPLTAPAARRAAAASPRTVPPRPAPRCCPRRDRWAAWP